MDFLSGSDMARAHSLWTWSVFTGHKNQQPCARAMNMGVNRDCPCGNGSCESVFSQNFKGHVTHVLSFNVFLSLFVYCSI